MSVDKRVILGGIVDRRECWGLTWRGRVLVAGVVLALTTLLVRVIYPFLAPTERVGAQLLVIEGWSPAILMKQAAAEFKSGNYDLTVLIRPILDVGDKYESGRYSADWMTRLLVRDGIPDDKVTTLCPDVARKDRTYHSALAVKEWITAQNLPVKALAVATEGPHARRSWLMYEKAFGPSVRIGIIAMQSPVYDPRHWWRTSEGVRDVLGESVAYIYARCFFWPDQPPALSPAASNPVKPNQGRSNQIKPVSFTVPPCGYHETS